MYIFKCAFACFGENRDARRWFSLLCTSAGSNASQNTLTWEIIMGRLLIKSPERSPGQSFWVCLGSLGFKFWHSYYLGWSQVCHFRIGPWHSLDILDSRTDSHVQHLTAKGNTQRMEGSSARFRSLIDSGSKPYGERHTVSYRQALNMKNI